MKLKRTKRIGLLALAAVLCIFNVNFAFADTGIFKEVVPCKYSSVGNFHEGLAKVEFNGKWGYIDRAGNVVIPIKYETATDFNEGWACVMDLQNYGYNTHYIDKSGKTVLKLPKNHLDFGSGFHEGLAAVYYWNNQGDLATAFIDKTGKKVLDFGTQYHHLSNFNQGIAFAQTLGEGGEEGFYDVIIDRTGKNLIPEETYLIPIGLNLEEGLIKALSLKAVSDGKTPYLTHSTVYLDKTGKEIISPWEMGFEPFDYCKNSFSDGLLLLKEPIIGKGYNYVYLDNTGKEVVRWNSPDFTDMFFRFSEGLALFISPKRSGFINKSGEVVLHLKDCTPLHGCGFSEGLAMVGNTKNDKFVYEVIDKTGKVVFSRDYMDAIFIGPFEDGVAYFQGENLKFGFVDKTGKELMSPQYDSIYLVGNSVNNTFYQKAEEGRIPVCKNYKWGFVGFDDGKTMPAPAPTAPAVEPTPATPTATPAPSSIKAVPTASKVLINGKDTAFDAYNIGGHNFFKLRDIAYVLTDTDKKFEVAWDNAAKSISLTSGKTYTKVGDEMAAPATAQKSATKSNAKLLIDGQDVALTAYNIGGNNYFKLRDLGKALKFGVDWDGAAKSVVVDTSKDYSEK